MGQVEVIWSYFMQNFDILKLGVSFKVYKRRFMM